MQPFLFLVATLVVALWVTKSWRLLLRDTQGVMRTMGEDMQTVGLGGRPSMGGGSPMSGVLARAVQQAPAHNWMNNVSSQGAMTTHHPDEDLDPLPFREQNNGGFIDATHTQLSFLARPQRPFRGERLLVSAFTTISGLDPFSVLALVLPIFVGMAPVGSAQGNFPLSAFQRDGFGVRLSFPASGQGTDVTIIVQSLLTPTGSDTIGVVIGAIGGAVR